jgi:ubiquinone/menaquinone biosynthesis C-methylase UbiE
MDTTSFEYRLENSRLRSIVRDHMEVKPLREATDVGAIPRALQIACGNGSPTKLILKRFSIGKMSAIDREEELIAVARERHAFGKVEYFAQDVFTMSFEDESFDAVFNLADLHNYGDWEAGLLELRRVLKRGGLLIMEELSRESFSHAAGKLFRKLTDHPYDSMLTMEGFRASALRNGFEILRFEERNPLGLLLYFIMVARKL